jgi:hypothetical protein
LGLWMRTFFLTDFFFKTTSRGFSEDICTWSKQQHSCTPRTEMMRTLWMFVTASLLVPWISGGPIRYSPLQKKGAM